MGIGTALLKHLERLAADEAPIRQYVIRSEALQSDAEAFYTRQGYTRDFVELKLLRDLAAPLPNLPLEEIDSWSAQNAPVFHTLYHESFSERPGYRPIDPAEWIADHADYETFRPNLSLIARSDGQPAGFITVFLNDETPQEGYISQVGTSPRSRGRRIGAGLITAVMAKLKDEGLTSACLHVNENNARAIGVYEQLGFERVGRRGKFSRIPTKSVY